MKFIPFLTISPSLDPSEDPMYARLKSENEMFTTISKETVLERQAEREAIQDLKAQLNDARNNFNIAMQSLYQEKQLNMKLSKQEEEDLEESL